MADAELMADAEIMADAELVAEAEIMTDTDLMADDEIMAVPELMADAEIMADAELVADPEIMADAELVADGEVFDDSGGVEDKLLPEQFEESLDDHEKLLDLLSESNTLCSVHRAQEKVQRFRDTKDKDLRRVSSNPTCLTVVGGNKVKSNHGTFRFNLGPGDNGEFHEVVCVGMSDVMASFGSYDLSEIAEEYRNQADEEDKNVVLPERVGGSRVHLLLGIKNTNLDPVLVKVLSSGIAVYLSPFKDIYGSRIKFAGPHRSFTKSDNGLKTEM